MCLGDGVGAESAACGGICTGIVMRDGGNCEVITGLVVVVVVVGAGAL
jgi:hypothetical protein